VCIIKDNCTLLSSVSPLGIHPGLTPGGPWVDPEWIACFTLRNMRYAISAKDEPHFDEETIIFYIQDG
jgi:hypothetical protein